MGARPRTLLLLLLLLLPTTGLLPALPRAVNARLLLAPRQLPLGRRAAA
jgi:hypothetical protein